MTFELCDSENGLITSISIEMSEMRFSTKEYLENSPKIKDKRFIINVDNITIDELREMSKDISGFSSKEEYPLKEEKSVEEIIEPKTQDKHQQTKVTTLLTEKEVKHEPLNKYIGDVIFKLLKEKSMCAYEIAAILHVQTEEISDKLNNMRKNGLLSYKIIGSDRYFSITKEG